VPTYEYVCKACKRAFEVQHGIHEPAPAACEHCGGELRRIFYPPGVVFKGGGFYSTENRFRRTADQRDSHKKDESKTDSASSKEPAGASSSKSSHSKSSSQRAGTEKSA
jgi:putative FmdB family regulatory protein